MSARHYSEDARRRMREGGVNGASKGAAGLAACREEGIAWARDWRARRVHFFDAIERDGLYPLDCTTVDQAIGIAP